MRKISAPALSIALVLGLAHSSLFAQDGDGFERTYRSEWVGARQRVEAIAGAFPEGIYAWRPDEGVRSTSEVLMHVAYGNFMFADLLGSPRPQDLPENLESVAGKAIVLALLARSYDRVERALDEVFAADLDRDLPVASQSQYFSTSRDVLLRALAHSNEHGGQLVAYARMNGVVPPWSQ